MKRLLLLVFLTFLFFAPRSHAQVAYGNASGYSLRKLNKSYSGNAIEVRRSCDNAVMDINFLACGDLDTVTMKTFVVAANPLSSITTSAAAAFSLRRLRCAYAGNAIQIRRSVDNATLNIGFTSWGDLDTVTMKTFVGNNSAFVVTWYDQSGNNRNATQATNASQPRIMNAGVIERQNTKPAIRWLGINSSLRTANFSAFGSVVCFNSVAKANSDLSFNAIANKCTANIPSPLDFYNNQIVVGNGAGFNFYTTSTTFNSAQPLGIWTYQAVNGGNVNAWYNSTSVAAGVSGVYAEGGNPLFIGSRNDGVTGLDGWISEVITWGSAPGNTERNFVEWTQSAYYNISGPLLTPIPPGAHSGFVTTWYDQSGNGFDVEQVTNASQPRIINVGVIEKSGTKATVRFHGIPTHLVSALPATSYPITISLHGHTAGAVTNGAFVKYGGINNVNNTTSGFGIGIGSSGGDYDIAGTSLIGVKEWNVWCPSSPNVNYPATPFTVTHIQQSAGNGYGQTSFLNGTAVPLANSNGTVGAAITGSLYVGGYINATNRFPLVRESEVIIFPTALNNTRRILLETNRSAHYNIAIANNKYTPPSPTTYNLYVNGVGRESATDSVNGTRASAGMGFLVGTAGTDYLKDNGDYITAGISCPNSPATSTLNLPGGVVTRWLNDWYVNKTDVNNNAGNLRFYFDFSDYGFAVFPGVPANYRLLYRTGPAANFTVVPGVTPSVSGDRVLFLVDAANITTNYYYTIGTTSNNASPLPVELTEFVAVKSGTEVDVKWTTFLEVNTDYFTVQRSENGQDFSDIGNVKAAGNSAGEKNYLLTDKKPLPGISYYRLKQADRDQSFVYSNIVQINFEKDAVPVAYPNPSSGAFTLENCKGYDRVIVMDMLGKQLYSSSISENSVHLDLSFLESGEYFLTATSVSGKKNTLKVLIE